ncbi:MAG TPA: peptidylprolyl isomerase, partial [Bryobacteraceae bacterium]|nr:peptidylprolyl isomerase [Bryobacteraceae bacterium]
MKFFPCLVVLLPFSLLAQQPAPKPASPGQPYLGLAAPQTAAPAVPPDKVVLTVGDTKLTAAQFEAIIESLPEQYRASARGPGRKQFAESLVRIMVLAQEGKRRKLDETPAFKTQAQFQELNLLAGETYSAIGNSTSVDDAALRGYYDAHKTDYEQVRARHILIRMAGSPLPLKPGQKDLTEQEALAKCQQLRKEILGGADFAAVAKRESDDTGSAANGGDLNFFHRGQMVPPFEQAAFA